MTHEYYRTPKEVEKYEDELEQHLMTDQPMPAQDQPDQPSQPPRAHLSGIDMPGLTGSRNTEQNDSGNQGGDK